MVKDFIINVSDMTKGVSQRGFGTILVLSHEVEKEFTVIESMKDLDVSAETETFKVVQTIFAQGNPIRVALVGTVSEDAKVQVELLKGVEKEDFFGVVNTDNTIGTVKAIAEAVGSMEKFYFATINDVEFENTILLDNTAIFYHKDKSQKLGAGIASTMLSRNIGVMTAKFKEVKGCTHSQVTPTEMSNLKKQNVNMHVERLGIKYITEGVSSSGQYIDVVLAKFYTRFRLEEDMLLHFTSTDNVDFTNSGIGEMVGVLETRMAREQNRGMLESYSIDYLKKAEIPKSEIATRKYNYLKVQGVLAGAIHGANINVFFVL